MPIRWPKKRIIGCVQRYLPRFLATAWAAFAAATAVAYMDMVPPQLEAVDGATLTPVWALWFLAAGALLFGAFMPPNEQGEAYPVARWARIFGMAIIAAELVIWTAAFFMSQPRGWVTGKNYLMLAVSALFCTWTIARDKARVRQVADSGD